MNLDATISEPDEDGYCIVTITVDGKEFDRHSIRSDMAEQWAAQEIECLAEYAQ